MLKRSSNQFIVRTRSGQGGEVRCNGPFLFGDKASPAEYGAGLKFAIDMGWIELHESGTFVKFTQAGAEWSA